MNDRTRDTSRETILERLRSRSVGDPPLPEIDTARLTRFDDPIAKFVEMLQFVGGQPHVVESEAEIQSILGELGPFANAKQIVSLVPGVHAGTVDPETVNDPHDFGSLDWVIASGEFPVAENGSIWVPGYSLPDRVLLFIPQYLAIVVSREQIVHNMHEAYARIGRPPKGFGVFVSGPSKTADIEQSLVLGAHGCRALQVFLTP